MKSSILAFVILASAAAPAGAQWLNYPTPDLPRTAEGKPDFKAPTPRTADGKPDLSGLWRLNGLGYSFNIFGNQKVEMLPWAQELYAKRSIGYGKDSPDSNCLPTGPRAGLFGMDPVKFVQTKNLLIIMYEGEPTRQVFLDGRPLPKDPNPSWMGYSTGHWDGDTLVVETTGYNERTWLDIPGHPHTEALHVTERYRRLDTGRMQMEMTFEDPKTYTRPWTIAIDGQLVPDTDLLEAVCNENEKDSHRYVGDAHAEHASAVRLAPAVLAAYAGDYNAGPLGILRVSSVGDSLGIVLPGGGARHVLVARSDQDFLIPDLGTPLTFVRSSTGDVTHLRLTIVEGDIEAPRVK